MFYEMTIGNTYQNYSIALFPIYVTFYFVVKMSF